MIFLHLQQAVNTSNKTPRTLLTRLGVFTLFKFTHANRNSATASVFYVDLVCSLKMALTASKHVGA